MDEQTVEALASGEPDPHMERLRREFDTEVWEGCMHHDCIPACDVSNHVCGRYAREWWRFLAEYGSKAS